ncbi:unnamed protein product [Durusdinium trenchii]|uniref:Uncharacterized protein n=1 Tax=Durusdinium trenchii TaxID=1381693 RepID=A0ABP0KKK3_9DINO
MKAHRGIARRIADIERCNYPMAGAGYPTGTVESVKAPAGCPQLVPDEPPSKDLAAGVADCVVNPLQAQYTWDSLTTLIESCRRLRKNNWEAMAEFPKRGPFFEDMPKNGPSTSEMITGA